MKVAIVGSRSIRNREQVYHIIDKYLQAMDIAIPVILSGGSAGVDSIVKDYAKACGYDFVLFGPYHMLDDRVEFKPAFFFARNRQIVNNCDTLIAIWDTKSKGTQHTIKYAQSLGKQVALIKLVT